MTKTLDLGGGLLLPALDAQTQTLVVYGGKGMGKTNFGSVLAEELAGAGLRFSWLDPYGVGWGLKYSADGKGDGLPILKIGGTRADLKLVPSTKAATSVADLVVDEDVSVLIDISRHADGKMWSNGEKIRFVRDYCNHLFMRQGERRRPLMQVIDEAGRFVPQQMPKGAVDIAECVGAIEQLVEIGRNVGVGVTLITQRSARMNKSVSELAEAMVAFRTVGPNSIDAIMDWFGDHIPKARQRELIEQVRELPRGTALVVSPGWLHVEGAYAIRPRWTFDSSETPRAGQERRVSGHGARVDREKYAARMAEIEEEAEANNPAALKKELREARNEIARLSNQTVSAPEPVIERIEVPVVPPGFDDALTEAMKVVERTGNELSIVGDALSEMRSLVSRVQGAGSAVTARPAAPQRTVVNRVRSQEAPDAGTPSAELSKQALRLLQEAARRHPMALTPSQLSTLSGYSRKSSTWGPSVRELLSRALLEEAAGKYAVTAPGLDLIGVQIEQSRTPAELLAMWCRKLPSQQPATFLRAIVAAGSSGISRDELSAATGYSRTSSTFTPSIAALTENGLVTDFNGVLVATNELLEVR